MAKTAVTPTREENFSEWYQNVITAAELAENSPSAGCMTVKPYGWAIWELMQAELDKRIKEVGVQNCQFPTLIPVDFLSREAQHVEGFAKESMIVTHHRLKMGADKKLIADPDSVLAEPYIMRPTSETIIGEAMSRWIQSYRDLPMKLNQWCSVFRWEMRARMFLRSREFFWQEGHNVFATEEEAREDAMKMHGIYNEYMKDVLAINSIVGEKTPEERFAGADNTYTREQIMQDGKALQVGTSHYLGQHFSKSFDIKYLGADGQLHYAHTTSWGTTSRMIGSVIMSHGDDDGLVLPVRIAPYQAVIIPIVRDENAEALNEYAEMIGEELRERGIRVMVDVSDVQTSDKIWKWIRRGAPLRIEVGMREKDAFSATVTRRDLGKVSQRTMPLTELYNSVPGLLETIHEDMLAKNEAMCKSMIAEVSDLEGLKAKLEADWKGFVRLPYDATLAPGFDVLMEKYRISRRCLDEADPKFVFVAKCY